jgi:AcrR family transcriptional regulator
MVPQKVLDSRSITRYLFMRMNVHPLKVRGRPRTGGRREDVLEAALTLFSERGFHGTAIPDIAAAAGLAAGTIYRHFASKEALVNELFRRAKRALGAALATVPETGELRARFHTLWWALVGFARDQPRAFAFLELHHHGTYLDAESRALELSILAPFAAVLGPARAVPLMVTVWGTFVSLIKHARLGYYVLTDDLCAQVEATCWNAIAN